MGLIKNLTYKGINLGSSNRANTKVIIDDVQKSLTLNTSVFNNQTEHGSKASRTLAQGRLYTIKGRVVVDLSNANKRIGKKTLDPIILPEGNLSNDEYYTLSWEEYDGTTYYDTAKVYSVPSFDEITACASEVGFTFELFSQNAYYTSVTRQVTGGYGLQGGFILSTVLPSTMDGETGVITCVNSGDFNAPIKVTIEGEIENPVIYNKTNGLQYGLDYTTTDLVVDNTVKPVSIKDGESNISAYRKPGSIMVSLDPGTNELLILGDNYTWNAGEVLTDQKQETDTGTLAFGLATIQYIAQQFTPVQDTCLRVDFKTSTKSGATFPDVVFSIEADDGSDNPDGSPIVSENLGELTFNTDYTILFDTISLTPGQKYWIVLAAQSDTGGFYRLKTAGGDVYPGLFKRYNVGTATWSASSDDMYFVEYYNPGDNISVTIDYSDSNAHS